MAADVKLIIDTDAGFDVDDIHALAVAHNLEKQGRVDILATVTSTAYQYSIAGVSVINNYYGRGDIPLGAYKGPFGWDEGGQNTYLTDLVNNFPNGGIKNRDDVPDVLDTYVKVLGEAEDNTVTIACIGFPMNIRNLLTYHKDLFTQKVKEIHYMNGGYNFGCAAGFLGGDSDCHGAAQ
jgi:inosine-uridine nucleoside N-ribohydrolase